MADRKPPAGKAPLDLFDLDLTGWVRGSAGGAKSGGKGRGKAVRGRALYVGAGATAADAAAELELPWADWQQERLAKKRGEPVLVPTEAGPVWILTPAARPAGGSHGGLLDASPYALARDVFGVLAGQVQDFAIGELAVSFAGASQDEVLGALVGLELGAYRFRQVRQPATLPNPRPRLVLEGVDAATAEQAGLLGVATNLARHLVNLPPSTLDPAAFTDAVQRLFAGSATSKVEVWTGKRLEKERMGLLCAVGQGAQNGPALVRISYRPKGKARGQRPVALVGKGITFDTGGLDMKDAASMRLMKKDMGGAASVCALAWWAEATGLDQPLDCYLALAENAVDQLSFKPGDVLVARNGQTVEIDNTDAEGRLVLADALDVALGQEGKDAPACVINLATLTGAMRIGLGTRIAGLFANDDVLAQALLDASAARGDPAWRMPLYAEYAPHLKSVVADVANSGPGRFGGAITAALFLARFVGQARWAHVDMYAWTDGGNSALNEPGGNGQCVQSLSRYLTALVSNS